MTRLSRRDRAALSHALECLRVTSSDALTCIRVADVVLDAVADDSPLRAWLPEMTISAKSSRVIRARFALAIRTILRADANDLGWRLRINGCPGLGEHTASEVAKYGSRLRCGATGTNSRPGGPWRCSRCQRPVGPISPLWAGMARASAVVRRM